MLIFGVGVGVSIYEGILHLLHPNPLEDPTWSYVVLVLAMLFEGIAFVIAFKQFQAIKGEQSTWQAIRTSKDPTTFVVLFEDSAAMLGLLAALIGIFLAHQLNNPYFDGAASIVIGLILASVAFFIGYETKGLGEGADPRTLQSIRALAEAVPEIITVARPLTMHFGPHGLSGTQRQSAIDRLEKLFNASMKRSRMCLSKPDHCPEIGLSNHRAEMTMISKDGTRKPQNGDNG